MGQEITVESFNSDDKCSLFDFYTEAYAGRAIYKFPERWEWLHNKNPWTNSQEPTVFIARNNEKIIGHTASMKVPCILKNNNILLTWSIDTFVLPEYRGMGVGEKLQKINQSNSSFFASLSTSPANVFIKKKIGANEGPHTFLLFKPFFYSQAKIIKKATFIFCKLLPKKIAKIGAYTAYPFCLMTNLICFILVQAWLKLTTKSMVKSSTNHNLKTTLNSTNFSSKYDSFWEKVKISYSFAVERNSKYLNWKFRDQPHINYQVLELSDRNNSHLLGYSIFRVGQAPEPKVGIIAEIIVLDQKIEFFECLLRETIKNLKQEKVTQIQLSTSVQSMIPTIKKFGFIPVEKRPIIWNYLEQDDKLPQIKNALISKGDHDWDQYPRAKEMSYLEILLKTSKLKLSEITSMW